MSNAIGWFPRSIALSLSLAPSVAFQVPLGQSSVIAAPGGDEESLRRLAVQFFARYGAEDLEGFMVLWSAQSPELATRREAAQKFFTEHEKIEISNLTVQSLKVDKDAATLLVALVMSMIDAGTGRPAASVGTLHRSLYCVRHGDAWYVSREVSANEELAAAVAAARTAEERNIVLSEAPALHTAASVRAMITEANRRYLKGNYEEALTIYRLAQVLAKRLGDEEGVARTAGSIGNVYYSQGDYPRALEHYQDSLALAEAAGDKVAIGKTLNNLGAVSAEQGNYSQALEYYTKSLAIAEAAGNRVGVAGTLRNLGVVRMSQGDYAQAFADLEKSLKIATASGDRYTLAETLGSLGLAYKLQGNNARAFESHHKSLALAEADGNKASIARALNSIGIVYHSQGLYAQALECHRKSAELYEAIGNKTGLANALGNIAAVHGLEGKHSESLADYQKRLALAEVLGDRTSIARTLNNIGETHARQHNYATALEYHFRGLELAETLGNREEIARDAANVADVYHMQGDQGRALEFAERAHAIASQIGNREILLNSRVVAGKAYQALQRTTEARKAFEDAVGTVEALRTELAGGEEEHERFFESQLASYHALIQLLVAARQSSEAFDYAERAKGRALLDALERGRVDFSQQLTAQQLETERSMKANLVSLNAQLYRENLRREPDDARLADLRERQRKGRLAYEAFRAGLYATHPDVKVKRAESPPFVLEDAGRLLRDDSAALEYVVTEEKTYLFVLTKRRDQKAAELSAYTIEVARRDLAERVRGFREQLARRDLGFGKTAAELYGLLLGPAEAQLDNKTSLVIVPDRVLWELPFQALMTRNRYVLQKHAVAYAPSLTVLREMVELQGRREISSAGGRVLALGNPALGDVKQERLKFVYRDEDLRQLPEAEREVKELGRLYGEGASRVYVGPEAREDRVKAEARAYGVVHLATHGILNEASPLYSHLVLSQVGGADATEDGILEAWELMQLDLDADLVVLSACETARGRIGDGEGVIGLAWALFVAGVPTTVVSQWKVDSISTTELMLEFHRRLIAAKKAHTARPPTANALQHA